MTGCTSLNSAKASSQHSTIMYVIDIRHYLNDKGDIAPAKGPARKLALFATAVIAHASDFDRPEDTPGPVCFECRKRDNHRVDTGIDADETLLWYCPACGGTGRISHWQSTFWDLGQGLLAD